MKKSNIIKLFITFICIFAISFVSDNVYGYQLKYRAFRDESSAKNGAIVRTYARTKDEPKGIGQWFPGDSSLQYYSSSYNAYEIVFHKQYISNYENGWIKGKKYINAGYDKSKKNQVISSEQLKATNATINLSQWIETNKVTVTGYNQNVYNNSLKYSKDGYNFYEMRNAYVYQADDQDQSITISDWYISNNIINKLRNDGYLDDGRALYFSIPHRTGFYGNQDWLSAYQAVLSITECGGGGSKYGWAQENRGIKETNGITGYGYQVEEGSKLASVGNSIINEYDNELVLPEEFNQPREVYIRHVDKKGNLLNIANSSEIKISNGNESIIKNGGGKTIGGKKYQEYYKINLSDTLKVSRSLTMATNGKLYSYDYAQVSTAGTAKDAAKYDTLDGKGSKNRKESDTPSFVVGNSKDNKDKSVTVVTFVYDEKPVPDYPNPDNPNGVTPPSGDIYTEFGANSNKSDCINKSTPTDKDVTPYLKAKKILLKDLKYKLEKNGNKIEYKMEKFNVQQLDGGKIDNNTSEYPETGTIFGNEKYTLFNSGTKKEVNMTENGLKSGMNFAIKFKTENNKGDLPTQDTVNAFVNNKKYVSSFDDFNTQENKRHIPKDKYNGVRNPKLFAHYKAVDVIKNKDISGGIGYIDSKNKVNLIIYNPLELERIKITSKEIINHTTQSSTTGSNIIQKNAEFTLNLKTKGSSYYTEIRDTLEYLDYYYLVFDMNVILKDSYQIRERSVDGESFGPLKTAASGTIVEKGTLIRIEKNKKEFKAIASSNEQNADIVSQIQNNVVLIGVTNNMPSKDLENLILKNEVKRHIIKNQSISEKYININKTSNVVDFASYCEANYEQKNYHESKYTNNHKMYSDAYYFAMATAKTTNVGRIYDFKVTDCSDIDYKSVFREGVSPTGVNNLKGVQYFSGIKRFNIYTNEINTLDDRENLNIKNSAAKKILPLGPYKNTNTSYINAPKLGYRISFDLKTSGYFDERHQNSTRSITIKPSYYYISKSGDNFNDRITLYYKNSNGKYVKFDGSNYTIYFKPNDGYRFKQNSAEAGNITNLSTKLEPLNIGSNSGFSLNTNMMSRADNDFIQAWYGEFKLPNSTIAVKEGGKISNPLTNGYIGVKFDIKCVDKDQDGNLIRELGYNQNNQNAENKINTTQWDYEGYLGFTNYGHRVDNITLQLEKGNWKIDDDVYQKIKGTVVLYDTDNRAANDFD